MYCPSCGKQIAEGSRFCGYCGESLVQIEKKPDNTASFAPRGKGNVSGHRSDPAGSEHPGAAAADSGKGGNILRQILPMSNPGALWVTAAAISLLQAVSLLLPSGVRMVYGTEFFYSYGRQMLSPRRPSQISVYGVLFLLIAVAEALSQAYFYLHRQRKKALIAGTVSVLVGLYTLSVVLYYDQFAATDFFGKWIYPAAVVISFLFSLNWEKLRKQ